MKRSIRLIIRNCYLAVGCYSEGCYREGSLYSISPNNNHSNCRQDVVFILNGLYSEVFLYIKRSLRFRTLGCYLEGCYKERSCQCITVLVCEVNRHWARLHFLPQLAPGVPVFAHWQRERRPGLWISLSALFVVFVFSIFHLLWERGSYSRWKNMVWTTVCQCL